MPLMGRILSAGIIMLASAPSARAVPPNFGAKASGAELFTGMVEDGGPGSSSASVIKANSFSAEASFLPNLTYLPELKAFSQNNNPENDDDRTNGTAEAYQVFTSAVGQEITLNVNLSATVMGDDSFVLANVFVYGGDDFQVSESSLCPDGSLGKFTFDGIYFCGSQLERANLFINQGDQPLNDILTFNVNGGAKFGVFAELTANSLDGSSDATQTLGLSFTNDENISPVDIPSSSTTVPEPDPSSIILGMGLIGLVFIRRRHLHSWRC